MRSFFLAATVLLSPVLASPHSKHMDNRHLQHAKNYPPIFANGTGPIGTGTGLLAPTGAPSATGVYPIYAQHNEDNGSAGIASPAMPDVPAAMPDVPSTTAANVNQAVDPIEANQTADPIEANQTAAPVNANADSCGGTVTVTVAASVTEVMSSPMGAQNEAASPLPIEPTAAASAATSAKTQASSEATALAEVSPGSSGSDSSESDSSAPASPANVAASPADAPAPQADVAASPADSPAPPANAAAPQAGLPFKTKRGVIASADSKDPLTAAIATGKISWFANWYSGPPSTTPANIQFVPQNYNLDSDDKGTFTKNAQKEIDTKGAKYLLSYGEPAAADHPVEKVVELFKKTMQPFADKGISISSPTTLQNDRDFDWLEQFLQACDGCSVGYLAIHYMGKADDGAVAGMQKTLTRAHDLALKYNIPGGVWLDNFLFAGPVEQQKELLTEAVPWLEAQDWLKAYAYVPNEVAEAGTGTSFIDGNGALNEFGRFYANL
ncbi:MAG: hypothetical protein Q9196_006508 [Gyalolechia fulgens]